MSNTLLWDLVKHNNAFLVKRDGTTFTKEANNLVQIPSPKYSGLTNKKAVGLAFGDKKAKKGTAVLTVRNQHSSRPAKLFHKYNMTSSARKSAKLLKANLKSTRPDLVHLALARVTRIKKAAKPVKKVSKKAATPVAK